MTAQQQAPEEQPVVRRRDKGPNGSGQKTTRGFRVEDELWHAAIARAHARGESLASVLCARLEEYVADDAVEDSPRTESTA